ncbi:MAG: 5-oxoprolinase, partial [Nitrospirae bacterium]
EVILHPLAGLFSALGIALARPTLTRATTFIMPFRQKAIPAIEEAFRKEEQRASLGEDYVVLRQLGLRVKNSEGEITVQWAPYGDMLQEFVHTHRQMFGFFEPGTEIETLTLRITAYKKEELLRDVFIMRQEVAEKGPEPVLWQDLYTDKGRLRAPVFRWDALPEGFTMEGPVLVVNSFTTVVVPENFRLRVDRGGLLRATLRKGTPQILIPTDRVDPAALEVFHRAFQSVATEMGEVLQRTARSVNIKERLDYSCAVFTPEGDLVANAPHIPVHLGAMAETVKKILKAVGDKMKEGDIYLSNNPYGGGSHLPDLTVVQPVFSEEGNLLFFVASRGHHPDIGGTSPGSMPAFCSHIDEEGVLIDKFLLMRDGHLREEALLEHLNAHPYPPRNPEDILYDLVAQIGACRRGEMRLKELTQRYSYPVVRAYMDFIIENGERAIKQAIVKLLNGKNHWERVFEDRLDDNSLLRVRIQAEAGPSPPETAFLTIDFSGSSREHQGDNLNAPLAVTKAAVLYVLRSIVEDDIPLNSGCLRPVKLIVPEGSILNPRWPCPVASGNVETSQRVVDLLLGCLGISAGSQGTMNNLLFQVQGEVPYYETIGGGYGGSVYCRGPSAVQVHMTNTRIT